MKLRALLLLACKLAKHEETSHSPVECAGGVLVFDEYGIHDWPGETKAVDEFLAEHSDQRLQTFTWTNTPGAYLIKV